MAAKSGHSLLKNALDVSKFDLQCNIHELQRSFIVPEFEKAPVPIITPDFLRVEFRMRIRTSFLQPCFAEKYSSPIAFAGELLDTRG
jgi:hypothetical protein